MLMGDIWPYLIFFGMLVAAGFGFPLPEEAGLAAAGVASAVPGGDPGSTPVRWYIMLPVCILAVLIADLGLYALGRRYGDRLLQNRWVARFVRPRTRKRIETNFHEYGLSILLFGRLVPGIRAPLFLTAGTIHLPLSRFLIADALGAVLGNTLFFFLGFWLGSGVVELLKRVEHLGPILFLCFAVAVVTFVIREFIRHPVSTGDLEEEVPIIGHKVAQVAHQIKEATPLAAAPTEPCPPQTGPAAKNPGESASPPRAAEQETSGPSPAPAIPTDHDPATNGQPASEARPHDVETRPGP
jgi:membrane protein DedA with SNARE-associated domain